MKAISCVISCAPVNEAVLKPTSEKKNNKLKTESFKKIIKKNKLKTMSQWRLSGGSNCYIIQKNKVNCHYEMTNICIQHNSRVLGWHVKNTWLFLSDFKVPGGKKKKSCIKREKSIATPCDPLSGITSPLSHKPPLIPKPFLLQLFRVFLYHQR